MARPSTQSPKLSANDLRRLLGEKHAGDVWITECKNGPTWSTEGLLKLDGWAMRRSWSHYGSVGYEIKVSRSDFEQDQKWPRYLDYCHEFYFVCPAGLIGSTELPAGVGLMWASVNGQRLFTKTKAARREPDPAKFTQLLSYALMCRSRIVADMHEANGATAEAVDHLERIRRDVEEQDKRRALSVYVNQHIRERFADQQLELEDMRKKVELAEAVRAHAERMGIVWSESTWSSWQITRQLDQLAGAIDPSIRSQMQSLRRELDQMIDLVDRLTEHKPQEAANG